MIARACDGLLRALNMLASFGVVVIMLLIAADVIGRAGFNRPLVGVPEIVKIAVVCVVWLQIAYTLRAGQHLRSSLIFAVLPRAARRVIWSLNCLLGIGVFGMIAWAAEDNVLKALARGTFEGEHPVRIPVWPVWAILVLGAALTAAEYLVQFVRVARDRETWVVDETERRGDAPEDAL